MTTAHLLLHDVCAGYGDLTVLRNIEIEARAGMVLGIAGRNGVGKTTLMRALAGFIPPMTGTITVNGIDASNFPPHKRHGLGLTYSPQDSVTFAPLTLRENLTLHRKTSDLTVYRALFDRFPRIEERLSQVAGTLSGGERKILAFCRVMAEGGSIVCLDEPSEGVQPENIHHMAAEIRNAAEAGRIVVLVEQNISLIEAVADRVIILDHGEIIHAQKAGPTLRADIAEKLKV